MRIVARLSRAANIHFARHIQTAAHRVPACFCRHARTRSALTPHQWHIKQVSTAVLAVEEEVRERAFNKCMTQPLVSMQCPAELSTHLGQRYRGRGFGCAYGWVPSMLNAGCTCRQRPWMRVLVILSTALQRQSGTRAPPRRPSCLPRPRARASTGPCRYWMTAATRCGTQISRAACGHASCACGLRVGRVARSAPAWFQPGRFQPARALPAQGMTGGSLAGLCVT